MSDPKHAIFHGDVNIKASEDSTSGPGNLILENATAILDVEGETFLDKTNINTTDGLFSVTGTNKISFTPSGVSGNIELTGSASSHLKTSAGNLQLDSEVGTLDLDGATVTIDSDTNAVSITGAAGVNATSTTGDIIIDANSTLDINSGTACLIDSGGIISIDANDTSNFTVTGGGDLLTKSGSGRAIIEGGKNAANAVTITTTNAAGGIDINSGSGGFDVLVTDGAFNINGQNVASNISLTTDGDAQDFTLAVTGTTNSSLIMSSSGTANDAIKLVSTNATSGITLDSGSGGFRQDTTGPIIMNATDDSSITLTGAYNLTQTSSAGRIILDAGSANANAITIGATNAAGGIDMNAGTGGVTVDTTSGFSLDSATASNITLTGTDVLTINNTAGQLLLQSTKAAVDAVKIYANNASGGIDIDSGSGGITVDSTNGISIDAQAAASNFSLATSGNAQDLTIAVTGNTDSSLVLSSTGTAVDAVKMTASAGGIDMNANTKVSIQTPDTTDGIQIGTTNENVPITIGASTSLVTIGGSLLISGTTTTVNTASLTIEDNIIHLNSGIGSLGIDSGITCRRYQTSNNTGAGDIVSDTAKATGAFQDGSATPGTLVLAASASAVDDFYNGWFIKITSGAGNNQVRRIKSYVGSTKTATLYVDSDNEAADADSSGFFDGLDLVTAPAETDTYSLYNKVHSNSFFDESSNKWTLAYSASEPQSTVTIQEYTSLHTGSINIHGVTSSNSLLNVNYINEHDTDQGVTVEGILFKDGFINGNVTDVTEIVELPDNSKVTTDTIESTATSGSFFIIVDAVQGTTLPDSNTRAIGGTFATFIASSRGVGGSMTRLTSATGSAGQRIDISWPTGSKILIYHEKEFSGGSGTLIPYRVKVIKVSS